MGSEEFTTLRVGSLTYEPDFKGSHFHFPALKELCLRHPEIPASLYRDIAVGCPSARSEMPVLSTSDFDVGLILPNLRHMRFQCVHLTAAHADWSASFPPTLESLEVLFFEFLCPLPPSLTHLRAAEQPKLSMIPQMLLNLRTLQLEISAEDASADGEISEFLASLPRSLETLCISKLRARFTEDHMTLLPDRLRFLKLHKPELIPKQLGGLIAFPPTLTELDIASPPYWGLAPLPRTLIRFTHGTDF